MFQAKTTWSYRIHSFKYQLLGFKDKKGIVKSEFVAKLN